MRGRVKITERGRNKTRVKRVSERNLGILFADHAQVRKLENPRERVDIFTLWMLRVCETATTCAQGGKRQTTEARSYHSNR